MRTRHRLLLYYTSIDQVPKLDNARSQFGFDYSGYVVSGILRDDRREQAEIYVTSTEQVEEQGETVS
jgi:hypothetical protein